MKLLFTATTLALFNKYGVNMRRNEVKDIPTDLAELLIKEFPMDFLDCGDFKDTYAKHNKMLKKNQTFKSK